MRPTPARFVVLRLYNLTLGRFALADRLFRGVLEYLLVWRKPPAERYTASAGFFDVRELDPPGPPETGG